MTTKRQGFAAVECKKDEQMSGTTMISVRMSYEMRRLIKERTKARGMSNPSELLRIVLRDYLAKADPPERATTDVCARCRRRPGCYCEDFRYPATGLADEPSTE